MMVLRTLLVLLMMASFPLGQQGSLLHELSHHQSQHRQSNGEKSSHGTLFCDQCLAHASVNGAPAPDSWRLPHLRSTEVKHAAQAAAPVTSLNLTPAARGPPYLA